MTPGHRVRSLEQVAHSLSLEQGAPAPALMLVAVVQHMAALAERRQVGVLVVGGVVVAVGRRQHHLGDPDPSEQVFVAQPMPEPTTPTVAPTRDLVISPASIAEMKDPLQVRACACLASSSRPAEADCVGELGPVDGVEEAVLRPDRHSCSPIYRFNKAKEPITLQG
ncbi:hypothetical protein G4G93_26305 [Methylobacterium sp. DB0501]|jgi:hypothetical protein|nr:hypothetical protein [Methylobacterium sp. DB0501]